MMKKLVIALAGVGFVALMADSALAASAKFTAAWEDNEVGLAIYRNNGETEHSRAAATEVMSTIHVPSHKELLIGVSGVANLVTFTEVKAVNKAGDSSAWAEGTLDLEVRVVPTGVDANCGSRLPADSMIAAPGALTFASRHQNLTVAVDLDVVDVDGTCGGDSQPECVADTLDIEGSVTVALGLDTTAAHHFNFVAPDLEQGTYDVVACFSGAADGGLSSDDNVANAFVAIKQRMVTVQEVRAVQGDFIEVE